MNAPTCLSSPPPGAGPDSRSGRLFDLARRAIAASSDLTSACIAGRAISDAQFARIDRAAGEARCRLLECLERDHGIDPAMADRLGALL